MRWIVYETRCLVSGKIYVGVHRQDEDGFDGYLGSGKALKRAIKKHGVENFVRRTLEEFSVEAEAYAREAEIVTDEFCKRRDTYNVKPGGVGGGAAHTPETREKMRGNKNALGNTGRLGKPHTPETREKIREKMRGNKNFLGHKHTPEAREKMRGNKNALGNKNFLGHKHSPEAREKMSEKMRGNKNGLGNTSRLGKPHTPEAREKIREANLRRWANHRNNAA